MMYNGGNRVFIEYGESTYPMIGHNADDLIFRGMVQTGEFYEIDLLRAIKEMNVNGTFVDVGSNIGNHSVFFARECASGYVIAIEAHPQLADLCALNLANNDAWKKSRVINRAVANFEGDVDLLVSSPINMGRSQLPKQGVSPDSIGLSGEMIKVHCSTLDNLLSLYENIAIIKLDIEGDEVAALQSGLDTIARFRPVIVSECSIPGERQQISQLLDPYGYVCTDVEYYPGVGPSFIWVAE